MRNSYSNMINKIIDYEEGSLSNTESIELIQDLINSGKVWKLQGSYGRIASQLIESGHCVLGKKGHRDYYGNYVPSRTEVKPGTKGSTEYQQKLQNID